MKRSIDAPSLRVLGGLSALLLVYALAPALFDDAAIAHVAEDATEIWPPVLMSYRQLDGRHFAASHSKSRIWMLHLILGSVRDRSRGATDDLARCGSCSCEVALDEPTDACRPLQHSKRVRSRYPGLHRVSGRAALLASLVLSVTGAMFARRDLSFTHPDPFHIHKLRVGGRVVFAVPTFEAQTALLGLMLPPLVFLTWRSARRRDIAAHRYWATTTTWVRSACTTI